MAERQSPTPRGGGERRQPSSYRDGGERRSSSYQDGGAPRRQTASPGGERRPSSHRDGGERRTASSRPGGESPRRQSPSRRNDVIRCENCGEDYSVTYKRCPFCDERPSRGGGSGKRVANTRGGGYGRPASALRAATWIGSFVVVCIAMVIVYRFMGAPLFGGGNKDPDSSRSSGASTSTTEPNTPPENPGGSSSAGSSVDDPPNVPAPAVESISLSKTDFTLNPGEEQELIATLLPAGVTGDITWSSSNEAAAAVDASGKVTNVNTGATNTKVTITAACGDVTATATVYCKPTGGTAAGGSQGTVVNADRGVNIRSGPGTDYDKVASVSNGSKVTVLGEENGWYKVSYSRDKIGYIRKDYISVR